MDREVLSCFQEITQQEYLDTDSQEYLENQGYTLISSLGVDRLVFETQNNTVIKVARNKDKIDVNYDEDAFWSQNKHGNLFCPIVSTGPHYTWIEMEYCTKKPSDFDKYKEKIDKSMWTIPDLHPDNIGLRNKTNELVCFDYPDAIKE